MKDVWGVAKPQILARISNSSTRPQVGNGLCSTPSKAVEHKPATSNTQPRFRLQPCTPPHSSEFNKRLEVAHAVTIGLLTTSRSSSRLLLHGQAQRLVTILPTVSHWLKGRMRQCTSTQICPWVQRCIGPLSMHKQATTSLGSNPLKVRPFTSMQSIGSITDLYEFVSCLRGWTVIQCLRWNQSLLAVWSRTAFRRIQHREDGRSTTVHTSLVQFHP